MADTLTPLAPDQITSQPVVPNVNIAPTQTVVPRAGTREGMNAAYNSAALTADPQKMLEFAKSASGTDFEEPALNAWRGMTNRLNQFDTITNAVENKGGIQSPNGRKELANQWEKAPEPNLMRGIAEYLLGNKEARLFVSEGRMKPITTMDANGNPLTEYWTESGRRDHVIDPITGKEVLPQEYAQRGGGIKDVTQTMPYVGKKETAEFNTKEANKANYATNELAAASGELGVLHSQVWSQWEKLGKEGNIDLLSPEERAQLGSFATRTVSLGQTASESAQALDQYTRGGSASLSESQRKTLEASLAKLGMRFGGEGSIVDEKGQKVHADKLNSLLSNNSFGKDFDQSFTQNKEQAMTQQILKKLGPEGQQAYSNILDGMKRIEDKKIELNQKHGANANLPFLVNPNMSGMVDQNARFMVQNLVGIYNAEITKDYADYRKEMLSHYAPGMAPPPGEIEAAYTRTQRYLDKKDAQAMQIKSAMNQVNQTPSTPKTNISEESVGGLAGQKAINAAKPAVPPAQQSKPTQTSEGPVTPPVPGTAPANQGFKVLPNNIRKFTVKE
jgi:hypothetical protein